MTKPNLQNDRNHHKLFIKVVHTAIKQRFLLNVEFSRSFRNHSNILIWCSINSLIINVEYICLIVVFHIFVETVIHCFSALFDEYTIGGQYCAV